MIVDYGQSSGVTFKRSEYMNNGDDGHNSSSTSESLLKKPNKSQAVAFEIVVSDGKEGVSLR